MTLSGDNTSAIGGVTLTAGTPSDVDTDTVKVSIPKTEALGTGKLFGRLKVEQ